MSPRMIRRCNDFGAGGVSVAIGELADGLDIDLNAVPYQYDGLDGTELAISSRRSAWLSLSVQRTWAPYCRSCEEISRLLLSQPLPTRTACAQTWNGVKIVDVFPAISQHQRLLQAR